MTKRFAVLLFLLAGVLALAASTQPWVMLALRQVSSAQRELSLVGSEVNAAVTPIALAVLALGIALTIAGPIFRYVLGAVSVLLGAGLAWAGAVGVAHPAAGASAQLSELTGITGGAQFEVVATVSLTPWPYLTIAAGALAAVAGVLVLGWSRTWRTGGRKYESGPRDAGETDRVSDWDRLTSGEDPSAEAGSAEDPSGEDRGSKDPSAERPSAEGPRSEDPSDTDLGTETPSGENRSTAAAVPPAPPATGGHDRAR